MKLDILTLVIQGHSEFYGVKHEVLEYFLETATDQQIGLVVLQPNKPQEEIERARELLDDFILELTILKSFPTQLSDQSSSPRGIN